MSPSLPLNSLTTDNDAYDGLDLQQDKDTHSGSHLALDLRSALADHDDDADTASQHSISFTSPAASLHGSPTLPHFSLADTSRRRSHPYTISTESSDDPDDTSLYNGRASSVTSPGEDSLDEHAKQVPPTPLPVASQNNAYPLVQPWSPGRSSVTSFGTTTSSYTKARPESLLIDPPKGPLVLGIALVDFNHQVRC